MPFQVYFEPFLAHLLKSSQSDSNTSPLPFLEEPVGLLIGFNFKGGLLSPSTDKLNSCSRYWNENYIEMFLDVKANLMSWGEVSLDEYEYVQAARFKVSGIDRVVE